MRLSSIRARFRGASGASLLGCVIVLLVAPAASAEDNWLPRKGVEALRPLQRIEPMVVFLNAQQAETPQVDDVLAAPPEEEAYDDWLDQSEYKGVPRVRGGHFDLPNLLAPTIATDQIGNGRTPRGFRYDEPAPIIPLPETSAYRGTLSWTTAYWAAANTYSSPRYFEDRMLERHGHERCPALTPVISGGRFFATIPMLPYLMSLSPACQCESTLGYYRSGSCAPAMCQRPPLDARAALVEAAAVAGFVLIIP